MGRLYSNPNDFRRGRNLPRRYPERLLVSGSDMEAMRVNRTLRNLEDDADDRLSRRHMREVQRHMPRIRHLRAMNRRVMRVPKDVLKTVMLLRLV